eukprot:COSAG01_NODE_44728_length_416_cov_0.716088_1_plen_73_part_00
MNTILLCVNLCVYIYVCEYYNMVVSEANLALRHTEGKPHTSLWDEKIDCSVTTPLLSAGKRIATTGSEVNID